MAAYHADAGCPERAEFERRVRTRLAGKRGPEPPRRFAVQIVRDAQGARGRLTLVGYETGSERALSAASCDEVADGLALVAALMLQEPALQTEARPRSDGDGAARAARRAPEHASSAALAERGSVAEPVGEASTGSLAEPIDPQVSAPEAKSEAAQTVAATASSTVAVEREAEPATQPSESFFSLPHLALFAAGFAAWGVAPNVRPGLGLGVSLSALARNGPRLSVLLGLRATLPDLHRSEDGRAQFVWFAAMTALCAEMPERRLRASGCAVVELGGLRASGAASVTGHAQTRFWGAVGPSLAGSLLVHPRVGLRLGGELLGVLLRDRYSLAEQAVFSVPRLAFRAELGLWVTIL